jgi:hypothetical protein
MTKVAIVPEPTETGAIGYRAIAGTKHGVGETAGQALDALTGMLSADESGTLIVVQNFHPDRFFTAQQQRRLKELMAQWRSARERGTQLSAADQAELDRLIEAEGRASAERAADMLRELDR